MLPGQPQDAAQAAQEAGASPAPAKGSQAVEIEEYSPLPDKRYNVTNTVESCCAILWCPFCGWTSKTLVLGDQEATLRTKNCCFANNQRRPYAQLGSVEKHMQCGCCYAIGSDLAPVNEKGEGGITPGCGCDEGIIDTIVNDLQHRKEKRGSIAQIHKTEYMTDTLTKLATQVPLLLDALGIKHRAPNPEQDTVQRSFPTKTYDVSSWIEVLCGCTTKNLVLESEEAVLEVQKCLGICETVRQKREYAQLGSVEGKKNCICCMSANSDLGEISPKCGCATALVGEIVTELQARMVTRGNIGQIQKQELMMKHLAELNKEVQLVLDKHSIAYPPPQVVMSQLYGSSPPAPPPPGTGVESMAAAAQKVEVKTYDITNNVNKICTCCFTCGIAGCTKTTLELKDEEVVLTTKNNVDDSRLRMPYAQLGSVEHQRACCCFHSVNMAEPGWGCDATLVKELTEELQARKVKRGNIAQLKQLEAMQSSSLELDLKADLVLDKEGVQFPPAQETMTRVFGGRPPRAAVMQGRHPHIEPARAFEHKTFDVTNYGEACCGCLASLGLCGWTTRTMELEAEEMLLTTKNFCLHSTQRTPYAQLGAVETETACLCCSELPEVASPGFGCSRALVDEIEGELQQRKVKRGNIAQLQMQENMMNEVLALSAKVELLLDKHQIAYPPSAATMVKIFAGAA